MKLTVDWDICQGHGRCVMVAPEFLDFQEGEDKPTVIVSDISESQKSLAQRACRSCPERALLLQE